MLPLLWGCVVKAIYFVLTHRHLHVSLARFQPLRVGFSERWPRGYVLLARRFGTDHFTGLPLTLLVAAVLVLIGITVGRITDVLFDPAVTEMDIAINAAISPYRTNDVLIVVKWLTHLAHSATLVAVALTATGFIVAKKLWNYLFPMWLVVVGAIGMTWAFKYIFMRERPDVMTDVTEWSPSFPSGHSTGAVAVYGFVAYIIARELTSSVQRIRLTYLTLLLIGTIALSRMLLSVHFLTDVIVGLLIGSFWLLAGFALREYWASQTTPIQTRPNHISPAI